MSTPWSRFDLAGQPVALPADDAGRADPLLEGMSRVERQIRMPVAFNLRLPREPASSFDARQAVRDRLAEALPGSTLDDVALVVSELVTNAVTHGVGEIELRIRVDGLEVRGEVSDQGGPFALPLGASGGASPGLGLFIVAQLVETWGVQRGTARVWFQLPVRGLST